MNSPPENNGRKTDGKFAKGNSLGGKTPGARHRVTRAVEDLLEGEHEALTRKAIEKALEGDMTALRLCLDRIAPPRKDSSLSLNWPTIHTATDALEASSAVLSNVAAGDVTPDEAGRLMALLTAHRTMIEVVDLAVRIGKLESGLKAAGSAK